MRFSSKLPPIEHREVLGVWRLRHIPMKMTRSIERVKEDLFLVSRWVDPVGNLQGGQDGIPLTKLSENIFQNQLNPNTLITVSPERLLSIVSEVDTMYGEPCKELWPV